MLMNSKNKNLPIIILLIVFTIIITGLIFYLRPATNRPTSVSFNNLLISKYKNRLKVGEHEIKIDIADNPEETGLGLSGRPSMCEDCGMYFDLGYKDTIPTFWMKDMLFPIDIVWIDDGIVVDITKNIPAPAPDTKNSELPRYRPSHTIDNVLEINAGYSDKLNIKPGDNVSLTE